MKQMWKQFNKSEIFLKIFGKSFKKLIFFYKNWKKAGNKVGKIWKKVALLKNTRPNNNSKKVKDEKIEKKLNKSWKTIWTNLKKSCQKVGKKLPKKLKQLKKKTFFLPKLKLSCKNWRKKSLKKV